MQHWIKKFRCAFRGLRLGTHKQSSFYVHVPVAGAVCLTAVLLGCNAIEWTILLLCIALVLSLEFCNSAIERLAQGLCHEQNEHVGASLDIASSAVLVASGFAVVIGVLILGPKINAIF